MQILKEQFPTIKTSKFRLSYTDFQPNATAYGNKLIKFIAKTKDIVFIKTFLIEQFAAVGLTTATIRFHDTASLPVSDNAEAEYTNFSGIAALTGTSGVIRWTQERSLSTPAPGQKLIGNMNLAYQIYATLKIDNALLINNLTAGIFEVWLGIMKNP